MPRVQLCHIRLSKTLAIVGMILLLVGLITTWLPGKCKVTEVIFQYPPFSAIPRCQQTAHRAAETQQFTQLLQ
jgi:hypothetical protein